MTVQARPITELQNNCYDYLPNFRSSMVTVIVILMCAFFIIGFISVYIHLCVQSPTVIATSRNQDAGVGSLRLGLDPVVVETFPVFIYSALKIEKGDLECAVCLSEFDDNQKLRLLPKCHHVFHHDCIDAWLVSHVTCPVCRAKLTPDSIELEDDPERPTESNNVLSQTISTSEIGGEILPHDRDQTVVVNGEQSCRSRELSQLTQAVELKRLGLYNEKFMRSHSTGHSLVEQSWDNMEKYTLILPEEVRRQLMITSSGKLKRCCSYDVVFPLVEGSTQCLSTMGRDC